MTTICPKCRQLRPADTPAPAWQCPACGVAYAKAGAAAHPPAAPRPAGYHAAPQRARLPWGLLLLAALVAAGAYLHQSGHGMGGLPGGGDMDEAALRRLAGSVSAGQVVMYSTTECGHCTTARGWLERHGFAFTECNMSLDRRCVDEFDALGATGTPYLVVRGPRGEHHMKEGFDSDEFVAALKG